MECIEYEVRKCDRLYFNLHESAELSDVQVYLYDLIQ